MNKVLVKMYIPMLDEQYDMWIPLNKRIYNVIILLSKAVCELTEGAYNPRKMPILYNKATGLNYDLESYVKDTDIINGSELVLI